MSVKLKPCTTTGSCSKSISEKKEQWVCGGQNLQVQQIYKLEFNQEITQHS